MIIWLTLKPLGGHPEGLIGFLTANYDTSPWAGSWYYLSFPVANFIKVSFMLCIKKITLWLISCPPPEASLLFQLWAPIHPLLNLPQEKKDHVYTTKLIGDSGSIGNEPFFLLKMWKFRLEYYCIDLGHWVPMSMMTSIKNKLDFENMWRKKMFFSAIPVSRRNTVKN